MIKLWEWFGVVMFWLTWPLIYVYSLITPPRTRVILIYQDQVLVVKNWLGAGSWALPGGGTHRGETALTAAVREVAEELGISLNSPMVQELGQHVSRERGGLQSKYYLFVTELAQKPSVTLQRHEIMAYRWVTLDALEHADERMSVTVTDALATWKARQNLLS